MDQWLYTYMFEPELISMEFRLDLLQGGEKLFILNKCIARFNTKQWCYLALMLWDTILIYHLDYRAEECEA